ncbi:MAG: ATP-binding cassette domain-containing protein, partial [Planctomycetaceae bacterium]|nr:ATP-binding cassette domain-containing protein [Planctomycetaceae bacterium]
MSPATAVAPRLEVRRICKSFPGVRALHNVSLQVFPGEVLSVVGENGAGKSTLMNVLAGLYKQAAGVIKVHGRPVSFNSPKDAIAHGVGMIHQHFMLVPTQTVTENILLGLDEPRFIMNLPHYDQKVRELQAQFGLQVDPTAKIWQLSV